MVEVCGADYATFSEDELLDALLADARFLVEDSGTAIVTLRGSAVDTGKR